MSEAKNERNEVREQGSKMTVGGGIEGRKRRWMESCRKEKGVGVSQPTSQALSTPLTGINTCSPDALCHRVVPLKPVMMMTHKVCKRARECVRMFLFMDVCWDMSGTYSL